MGLSKRMIYKNQQLFLSVAGQNIAIFGQTLTRVKSDERHLLYLLLQPRHTYVHQLSNTISLWCKYSLCFLVKYFLASVWQVLSAGPADSAWAGLHIRSHTEECGLWRQVADVWVEILLTTWVTSCSWPVDDGGYLKIIMKTASLRALACWLLSEKLNSKGHTAVV